MSYPGDTLHPHCCKKLVRVQLFGASSWSPAVAWTLSSAYIVPDFLNIFLLLKYHWAFKQKRIHLKRATHHRVAVRQTAAKIPE